MLILQRNRYHDLWHVKQSVRMPKTDPDPWAMYHSPREAIEGSRPVVFTTSNVPRFMKEATTASLQKIMTMRRALREHTGVIDDQENTFAADTPSETRTLPTSRKRRQCQAN